MEPEPTIEEMKNAANAATEEFLKELTTTSIEGEVNGRKRIIKVYEYEIDWEGKKEKVLIRKLSYGERAELLEKFTKVYIVGNQSRTEFSFKDMVINSLRMCIYKAPFPVTDAYIYYELDPDIGKELYDLIERLNQLSDTKKKNSNGASSTPQTTAGQTIP